MKSVPSVLPNLDLSTEKIRANLSKWRSGFIEPACGDPGQCLKQHHRRNANQGSAVAALTKNKWKIKTYT